MNARIPAAENRTNALEFYFISPRRAHHDHSVATRPRLSLLLRRHYGIASCSLALLCRSTMSQGFPHQPRKLDSSFLSCASCTQSSGRLCKSLSSPLSWPLDQFTQVYTAQLKPWPKLHFQLCAYSHGASNQPKEFDVCQSQLFV